MRYKASRPTGFFSGQGSSLKVGAAKSGRTVGQDQPGRRALEISSGRFTVDGIEGEDKAEESYNVLLYNL